MKLFVGVFALALVASIALIAIPAISYITAKNDKKALEDKVKIVERSETILNEYNASKNVLADVQKFQNYTVGPNDQLYNFIVDLEKILPKEMIVTSFSSTNGSVTMSGQCKGKEVFAKTLMQLKELDYVTAVYTGSGSETHNADEDVIVSFTITLNISVPKAEAENK